MFLIMGNAGFISSTVDPEIPSLNEVPSGFFDVEATLGRSVSPLFVQASGVSIMYYNMGLGFGVQGS